ncbi:MAG: D-arginine dehydrogenase [Candidatus Azotimanducaceae bacterium]|jgi:D-arginine dehydrogenase
MITNAFVDAYNVIKQISSSRLGKAMPIKSDVIIIGAGIAGTSMAAQLSGHCKVHLLEMEKHPGYHATGRSAAYYAPSYGNNTVRAITVASEKFFRQTGTEFSESNLLSPRSAIFVSTQAQEANFSVFTNENPKLALLNNREMKEIVPALKTDVLTAGALDLIGGDLNVDAILQGFLRQFLKQDGKLFSQTKIIDLSYKNEQWFVSSQDQTFTAPIIVNAAGAWADGIAELAGLSGLGIQAFKRTAILVDAPLLDPSLIKETSDMSNWPLVVDVDEQFYFKPDAGQLLISPADETPSSPCDAFADELDMAIAIDRVQQVLDIEVKKINHHWAGLRSFSPDKTFVVGLDPRAKGFFWLAGQGGYGVQTCPALADIAACQISGSHNIVAAEDAYLHNEAMRPDRFLKAISLS